MKSEDGSILLAAAGKSLITQIIFNGQLVTALIDSGSCESFVSENLIERMELNFTPVKSRVTMASSLYTVTTKGFLHVDITILFNRVSTHNFAFP